MEVAVTEQSVLDMTREAAMAFLEADADGDALLDYEEFRMAVPERMRGQTSEAALRELFNSADADGSGQISMSEFFLWTLTIAQSVGGKGLEAVFMRYDRDYRGTLDESEFAAACEEMGFGGLASELFSELDSDGSGTISYSELLGILKGRVNVVSKDCKRFLTTLAFDATKPRADTSARSGGLLSDVAKGWTLHGSDADALRLELREKLQAAKLKVSDLYRLMTRGQSRSLSAATFSSSMVEDLGFKGELSVLEGVFTDLDDDRSGVLGISELFGWINGKHSKAKLAKTVTLAYGRAEDARLAREARAAAAVDAAHKAAKAAGATAPPAPAAEEVSADESVFSLASIEWSAVTLLSELQDMLLRAQLLPLDLVDAYEGYAYEGQLSFKQFLKMMKRLVNPISVEELDLWDIEVGPAVTAL
jgi:Ca2+-binding EF-hand superfamily protein